VNAMLVIGLLERLVRGLNARDGAEVAYWSFLRRRGPASAVASPWIRRSWPSSSILTRPSCLFFAIPSRVAALSSARSNVSQEAGDGVGDSC
jgi:hypothetical protein